MICPRCEGSGEIRASVPADPPKVPRGTWRKTACPLCRGTGQAPGWDKPLPGASTEPPRKDPA